MANNTVYKLPPDPQHAVLKKIYPWDEYNENLVMQWLYVQAKNTGFTGSFEDFKLRYGVYVEGLDEEGIHYTLENYEGMYNVIPLLEIEQVLHTKNKVLNQNIIIDPIPPEYVNKKPIYTGTYSITPRAFFGTTLHTKQTVLEKNIIVEPIPYRTELNEAGGYTAYIA